MDHVLIRLALLVLLCGCGKDAGKSDPSSAGDANFRNATESKAAKVRQLIITLDRASRYGYGGDSLYALTGNKSADELVRMGMEALPYLDEAIGDTNLPAQCRINAMRVWCEIARQNKLDVQTKLCGLLLAWERDPSLRREVKGDFVLASGAIRVIRELEKVADNRSIPELLKAIEGMEATADRSYEFNRRTTPEEDNEISHARETLNGCARVLRKIGTPQSSGALDSLHRSNHSSTRIAAKRQRAEGMEPEAATTYLEQEIANEGNPLVRDELRLLLQGIRGTRAVPR